VDLVSQLRQAIEKKEFYLVFHPQFNLIDQKMMGVETLIRWRKPDGEEVPPDVFIPIAEAKGLIHQIGFWVMEEAFKVLRRWQKRGSQRKMSVNVSVAQFIQEDFVEKVLDILDKTKVNPKQIILEITESGEIPDSKIEKLNQTIEVFRELGIEASHDDFGAGNSIDHLLRLSLDELKMDKSFWDSPNAKKLLKMVATLAQDLGVRLVVEGVETNEQLDSLKELGIDLMVQGYLFSKPLRLEVLEKSFGSS
jgi:EAL domain-containing protein (putative c-di-GMP-specific phosphodiesterase class I)